MFIRSLRNTHRIMIKNKPQCICINLSQIELQFMNVDQKVNLKMNENYSFMGTLQLRYRPRNDKYGWTCNLKLDHNGTFRMRVVHQQDHHKQLFFLVKIFTRQNIKIIQVECIDEAPYVIQNRSQQLTTYYQYQRMDNKILLEQGQQGMFCWDDPFQNKYLMLEIQAVEQPIPKYFSIDIDQFINQEIRIDKDFSHTIDKEFSIEIYQEGGQKVYIYIDNIIIEDSGEREGASVGAVGYGFDQHTAVGVVGDRQRRNHVHLMQELQVQA